MTDKAAEVRRYNWNGGSVSTGRWYATEGRSGIREAESRGWAGPKEIVCDGFTDTR